MASFLCVVILLLSTQYADALLPKWTSTYQMNLSTIIQPCNESGYFNDNALNKLAKFGLISIDWSNAKQLWANAAPMNCAETLLPQVTAIKSINPSAKTFVYRLINYYSTLYCNLLMYVYNMSQKIEIS